MDEGLKWATHIGNVRTRVGRLVGLLGRASTVLGRDKLKMLYNALVLPHLQYCLMVWGDFHEGRNKIAGESLLRLQKRLAGIVTRKRGLYHSDPILAELGILKVGDLYRQQLRLYAWRFWNEKLPENQRNLLTRVSDVHKYNTRSAENEIFTHTQDHRSIGYRVPKEWESVAKLLKERSSLCGFKKNSREEFLANYKAFKCVAKSCYVCGRSVGD